MKEKLKIAWGFIDGCIRIALYILLLFLIPPLIWVCGLIFGYGVSVCGSGGSFSLRTDIETGEAIEEATLHRHVIYTNRLGRTRHVTQMLPTVVRRTAGPGPYPCLTFEEAMEIAGVEPEERDGW